MPPTTAKELFIVTLEGFEREARRIHYAMTKAYAADEAFLDTEEERYGAVVEALNEYIQFIQGEG